MPGFDLGEGADDAEPETVDDEVDDASGSASADVEESASKSESEKATDPADEPAFGYSPDHQRAVYVREETWDSWEETKRWEVEKYLHDHGVDNALSREIDDVAFRILAECPELVAALVLEARGVDHDLAPAPDAALEGLLDDGDDAE